MMSISSKHKVTPQELWKELQDMGSKMFFTIPFGSPIDKMSGFIAVTGDKSTDFPILTICVGKLKEGSIVSTIIFPSVEEYVKFSESLYVDSAIRFSSNQIEE
jgi:hypothetical protein